MLPLNAALSMILFDLGAAFEKRCSEERCMCRLPLAGYGGRPSRAAMRRLRPRVPPLLRLE
jgi:hypothetical protein